MGKLMPLLVCHRVYGLRSDAPPPPTAYYLQQAGGKAAHRIMSTEVLVLFLTGCRTREKR